MKVDVTAVLVAAIAAVPTTLAAYWAYGAKKHSKNADHAVNNVPEGVPPLVERVGTLEPKVDYLVDAVSKIARVVGVKIESPQ